MRVDLSLTGSATVLTVITVTTWPFTPDFFGTELVTHQHYTVTHFLQRRVINIL